MKRVVHIKVWQCLSRCKSHLFYQMILCQGADHWCIYVVYGNNKHNDLVYVFVIYSGASKNREKKRTTKEALKLARMTS